MDQIPETATVQPSENQIHDPESHSINRRIYSSSDLSLPIILLCHVAFLIPGNYFKTIYFDIWVKSGETVHWVLSFGFNS